VPGHATPGGDIGWRSGIERDKPEQLARIHRRESAAKLEHELAAAELASVPFDNALNHRRLRSPV